MEMFVGRDVQLQYLENFFQKAENQLLVVYGNKGVGKTTLLKEFYKNKKYIYYMARACSPREQMVQWGTELVQNGLDLHSYPEYEEIFSAISNSINDTKTVLVLDEFHHMVKGDRIFFESLINFLKTTSSVMIVLSTSDSGWIENHFISEIGNKSNMINGFLKVRGLRFENMRAIYPRYSFEDSIRLFSVLGGNPGYWKSFSEELSFKENIIKNLLSKESRLYSEMTFFLEHTLREPAVYNTILTSLAQGRNKLNDIYHHTGFSRAKISVYLKNLMELDLVEKVSSLDTAGRANLMKGIYRISNPYVHFYYRYLFPNYSQLENLGAEAFYERIVEGSFELYIENTYRKICRERLEKSSKSISEWVGKDGIIDFIILDEQKVQCVGICKYTDTLTKADYDKLIYTMKQAKIDCHNVALFCEKGFERTLLEENTKNIRFLSINER